MLLLFLMIKIGKKNADSASVIIILLTGLILFSAGMLIQKSFYLGGEYSFGNNFLLSVKHKENRRRMHIITVPEIRCYTIKTIYIYPW
jgi:hypothetical protein